MADSKEKIAVKHPHVRQRLREGVLILFICLALYLLLAFTTYHQSDPGWSTTGHDEFAANAGGRAGAWISDVFLYLFGYMAYLLPFLIAGFAWFLFRVRNDETQYSRALIMLRIAGFVVFLTAGASILNLGLPGARSGVPLSSGGVLGEVVTPSLVSSFNLFGAWLITIALFLLGLTLLFGVSWVAVLRRSFDTLQTMLQSLWKRYQARRAKKRELAQKLAMMTPTPEVIAKPPKAVKKPALDIIPPKPQKPPKPAKAAKAKKADKGVDLSQDSNSSLPSIKLLDKPQQQSSPAYTAEELTELSRAVEMRLQEFGIAAEVVAAYPGPIVTRFELQLSPGMKVSKITGLAKDLARSLSKTSVRVVEVIPGKSVIGLEIPNEKREMVQLRDILESSDYLQAKSSLSIALGKDIAGHPVVADVAKMPHLLVAGTTGSGKSVSVNAMLLSILLKATPEQARFIMIDPKMLELSIYEGIPHLLTPVVTDMTEAANALRWCVAEMDKRYRLMASLSVRNLAGYNTKVQQAIDEGEAIPDPFFANNNEEEVTDVPTLAPLPQIVVVIDELADLMIVVGKKVEELIARIAQKARAAGIHMILATQRPSVDVITGLIKANIPARMSFQVSQRVDSRTILDQQGAEQLLGQGDMLYMPPGTSIPTRVHGPFVSDEEVVRVVAAWKKRGDPEYIEAILQGGEGASDVAGGGDGQSGDGEADPLYDKAVAIVVESQRASISLVQRRLKIGYNRAANLLETMEAAGLVSSMGSNGQRELLLPPPE